MKRTFLTAVLLTAFILTVPAHETGNTKWLGGSMSLTSQSNGVNQSTFSLSPEMGFYLDNGWSAGARVGFSTSKTEQMNETRTNNSFSLVPFVRKNFGAAGGFNFFGQGELPLTFSGGKNYDGSSMGGTSTFGLRVRPGLSYYFNESWGFKMLMPSVFSFSTSDGSSSFSLGINNGYTLQSYLLDTSIGFIYMF